MADAIAGGVRLAEACSAAAEGPSVRKWLPVLGIMSVTCSHGGRLAASPYGDLAHVLPLAF